MKDNFSRQAKDYAKFRPTYPTNLIQSLISLTNKQDNAWDCGTGNGQIATILSEYFVKVYATDISKNQIKNAPKKSNIIYKLESAETSSLPDTSVDLIVVAQAIHWFDFDKFYSQVKRVLADEGTIAVLGYGLLTINPDLDKVIRHFYTEIVGDYWDEERKYVDEQYKTIPFPFKEIQLPPFKIKYQWKFDQLIGYINTWSAVQHYIRNNNENPTRSIARELEKNWGEKDRVEVTFNLLTRVGKLS